MRNKDYNMYMADDSTNKVDPTTLLAFKRKVEEELGEPVKSGHIWSKSIDFKFEGKDVEA